MDGNKIKITFKKFDPINASSEIWSKFHTFRKLYHDLNKPEIPYTANQEYEKIRIAQKENENFIIDLIVVEYNQEILGREKPSRPDPSGIRPRTLSRPSPASCDSWPEKRHAPHSIRCLSEQGHV